MNEPLMFKKPRTVANTELKRHGKTMDGSLAVFDRRHGA
jgi:hypothetical protein